MKVMFVFKNNAMTGIVEGEKSGIYEIRRVEQPNTVYQIPANCTLAITE